MGSTRSESKTARLRAWLAERQPEHVGEAEWEELRAALAPVSEGYLRRLLRTSGVTLAPLIEGVVQDDFESLERTLRALEAEYANADRTRARLVRDLVIAAKDHLRWSLRRLEADSDTVAVKREMLLWLETWLENPPLFPVWVELRKRRPPCLPPRPLD